MNWFKANKFLTGLLAFVVLGGGVLGYMVFSAKSRADESLQKFQGAAADLQGLKGHPIYPSSENLKKLEAQRAEHQEHVDELLESLAGMAPTLEQITPEQFQDRLRETVNAFLKDAATASMTLPKGFYLGFDPYQNTPPRPEAAAYLGRSLKAIDFVMRQLLTAHVTELRSLEREPIPEESKPPPAAATAAGSGSRGGKPSTPAPAAELIKKRTFTVTFYGEQIATQKVVNTLAAEKNWFIILRNIFVKNEKQTGPSRSEGVPVVAPPAEPQPAAPGAPAAPPAKAFDFIVGEEKIETTMLVEVAVFNQADIKAGASKAGKPKTP